MKLALLAPVLATAQFLNHKVEQNVDLTASYARQTVTILAENTDTEPHAAYLVPFPESNWSDLILFEAQTTAGQDLEVRRLEEAKAYAIELLEPLAHGETLEFVYAIAFKDAINPLPLLALQSETQQLVYEGTKLVYSAYASEEQTTIIKTVTSKVTDLATGQEASVDNKIGGVQFGPVSRVEARTEKPLRLHYENPLPQVRFTECNRTIWVSHWSDAVSFDERFDMLNAGTQLKKPFSRLEYMAETSNRIKPTLSLSAIRSLRIPTGPGAIDTYYVDLVGNISTSSVGQGYIDAILRFPLFGGWRTEFTVGWTGRLASYVQALGSGLYALQVPIVRGPDGAQYDSVQTKVVLPEGATNIRISGKEPQAVLIDTTYSYLDLFGRPSITLTYNNLVGEHQRHSFGILYEYSLASALRKPLAYSAMVFALFIAALVFRNTDISLQR